MVNFELKKREILDRLDVLDLVSEHVTLKRSGRRWVGLCPFHTEKTPSFTVSPDLGLFKCFGCGKGGDIFSFVQFRENVPFIEAMRVLADRAGVELEESSPGQGPGVSRSAMAKLNTWAADFFRGRLMHESIGSEAREYVQSRGISDETSERFQIGLAVDASPDLRAAAIKAGFDDALLVEGDLLRHGDSGRHYETFRNRLMFPIRDATGRVVGFGGRTLVGDRAKYLNTRQNALFDKGRNLYGIETARDAARDAGRMILVEGYTDCIACHQAGHVNTVATLGTALTEAQVSLLRRYTDELVLLFDSDEAGEAAADRAIQVALPRCVTVRLTEIPDGKDPGEFLSRSQGVEAFSDVLKGAVDALEFKWRKTQRRFLGDGSAGQRREAVMDFMRVVAAAAASNAVDPIQRGLLVNQVAHLLGMRRDEVDQLMRQVKPRQRADEGRPASAEASPSGPVDPEQAAWGTLLEVVLNEPGLLSGQEQLPNVGRIADGRDRRIAEAVFSLAGELGEFRISDVLAKFEDAADVARVSALTDRGAARGNYEKTFHLALERLVRAAGAKCSDELESAVMEKAKGRSGFVPRRFTRTLLGSGTNDVSTPTTVVEQT